MKNLFYLGYCAGILCVSGRVEDTESALVELKESLKQKLLKKEVLISFGLGHSMPASEICVDFYPMLSIVQEKGFSIKI